MFDTNGDGMISIDELEGMMSKFGDKPEQDELNKMMKSVDTDGKLKKPFPPHLHPKENLLKSLHGIIVENSKIRMIYNHRF